MSSLDRYITINQPVDTLDAGGGNIRTWTKLRSVYATMYDKAVKETKENGKEVTMTYTMFKVRYDRNAIPTGKMQVNQGSDIYKIVGVREVGRREFWEIKTYRQL